MEPFDLTFHQVTSEENLSDTSSFDSFSNVVNYETTFDGSDQSLPLSTYNVNTLHYTWKDFTYPSTTAIQTANGGVPTGHNSTSVQHQPIWYSGTEGSPPHQSFLVHPDDSLAEFKTPQNSSSVSKQQLKVLAQISSNTSALTKEGKRCLKFVARTVTSPSTPIPPTPITMSEQVQNYTHLYQQAPPQSVESDIDSDEKDSSFETVAEALKLQWSVIGNKTLTPVSPDIVAQVVAQAEQKIKSGELNPSSLLSPAPSVTSSQDEENSTRETSLPPIAEIAGLLQESHKGDCPRELKRIIPTEITTEKKQSGPWFSSGTKPPEPILHESSGHVSPTYKDQKTASAPPGSDQLLNKEAASSSTSEAQANHKLIPPYTGSAILATNTDHPSDSVKELDVDMDKYIQSSLMAAGISTDYQLESEEFLRSLPPIKPINLDAFVNIPLLPARPPKTHERRQTSETSVNESPKSSKSRKPEEIQSNGVSPGNYINSAPSFQHSPTHQDSTTLGSSYAYYSTPDSHLKTMPHQHLFLHAGSPITANSPSDQTSLYHSALSAGDSPSLNTISKKQFDDLLKAKAKLQGQLEVLTEESQSMLKERTELQAQLATLKGKLAQLTATGAGSAGDANLKKEVENLRVSRQLLERTILDANRMLSEKAEEIRALQDEFQVAQESSSKLQVRSQEMRDEIRAKDMNVQALKNKIAELYVEVQMTIQAKMEADTEARTSRNDLVSLVKAKEWYQEQLQLAHDVRSKLQRELTILQGQTVSHGTIVERLKSESARLRQQLAETQQRALKDKELLARHLEAIQSDMTEREAAFLEIQRERKLYEDTFNYQVLTAEEEKSRLTMLQQATQDLEAQLDRAHNEAKRRHEELLSMENGQMDVMKRLAVAEKTLGEKESTLEEMEQKLIQMESQLQVVMSDLTKKDSEILALKEDKATTEIALKSALQEKASVDKALDVLKADMGKVELSFKQMKQELSVRLNELQQVQAEKEKLQEELDRSQHELEIKSLSVDAMTRNFDGQSAAQHDLQAAKINLEEQLHGMKLKIQELEYQLTQKEALLVSETEKVANLTAKVLELEVKLESTKESVSVETIKIYESEMEGLRLRIRALEETEVEEANMVEREKEQLQLEIAKLKDELLNRQKSYDENLDLLDRKLKELMSDKQQLEIELGIARRSEELTQLEERDSYTEEIQSLTKELQTERAARVELEQKLSSFQASKLAEIEALQQKLLYQSEALQSLQAWQLTASDIEATNQRLELDLEKERGRVMGLTQKNTELKEHSHELEAALALRESAFDDLKRSVEESVQDLDKRDQKFLDRISSLEMSVEKEVEVQRDLRKQMGTKIMENKRLKKQNDAIKLELEQLRQDLASAQHTATQAMNDLDVANRLSQDHLTEARESTTLIKSLEVELERARGDLTDNLARQTLLTEHIQSLEWQCSQKSREVAAAQEQIKLVEERAQTEVEAIKLTLQAKQSEIDSLQSELTVLRQDKSHQRSQVNELRGALKASVQHHKLTKRLNEADTNDKSVQANIERKIVIPPLPFDLATIEQLIQDTKVTPLDSRPLDQLSSCLSSLRAEITGLQKQMDRHTTAVHTSSQSWKNVQIEVNDLNEVMRTVANTIIAANSSSTIQMTTAVDRERADIMHI
ncbi:golgin subfamily A member 3 [Biomphalaria glabrata]|nr:golgin subfamily A member 3 [Biomphalaria glabrata]